MILKSITREVKNNKAVLSAEISYNQNTETQTLFFSYPEEYFDYLPQSADPFFPALLIPAMEMKEDLEIVPPISAKIIQNQPIIQDVFATWHPEKFSKINIIANNQTEIKAETQIIRNATFFSLGVDSMYSMLKYLPWQNPAKEKALTSLIYMKGLELPLSVYIKGQDKEVIDSVKKVAEHYKLEAIVGETNIRDIFPLDWEDYYFGPGLAATALSLSQGFRNVYIPSSHSYATLFPDPSSPLLDSLWSNENTFLFHDGSERERVQKITDMIVHDPFALKNLRVCVSNEGGNYNCGKCWKCIRTMITLEIIDKLHDCGSFPNQLPKNYSMQLRTYIIDSLEFTKENLRLAQKHGKKDLERILEREIRVGKLDLMRNGKPISYLVKEMAHYLYVKTARRMGFFS